MSYCFLPNCFFLQDFGEKCLFAALLILHYWRSNNLLQLNKSKTEVLNCGSSMSYLPSLVAQSFVVEGTRLCEDSWSDFWLWLLFSEQISAVVKGSFYLLRCIAKTKHFLSHKDLKIVIHSLFFLSRLDYCNSLDIGPMRYPACSNQNTAHQGY